MRNSKAETHYLKVRRGFPRRFHIKNPDGIFADTFFCHCCESKGFKLNYKQSLITERGLLCCHLLSTQGGFLTVTHNRYAKHLQPQSRSPCMCNSEAPLFVNVVVEQHAAEQPRRVAGRQARGDGGRGPPMSTWPFGLKQVLSQDLHQVLVQARVLGHGGHSQGVLVGHPHASLLCHAYPGVTTATSSSSSSQRNQV